MTYKDTPYWLCCGSRVYPHGEKRCLEAASGHPERVRFGTAEDHAVWDRKQSATTESERKVESLEALVAYQREQIAARDRELAKACQGRPTSEPPETYDSYDYSGEDHCVSDVVATNQGPAVYMDGEWLSVDWDAKENLRPLSGVTVWEPLPDLGVDHAQE